MGNKKMVDIIDSIKSGHYSRYLITKFLNIHHHNTEKDIAIFSSRRSGSTWLMEMISQFDRLKFISEPFNEGYLKYTKALGNIYHQYISLSDSEIDEIIEYLENDRYSRYCGPVNFFSDTYRFFSSRRVIKCTNANAMLPLLAEKSSLDLIYMIRHPIPQIMSTRKYPYKSVLQYYTQDDIFMENNLRKKQRDFAFDIYRFGSEIDSYICGWCLDNLLPLRIFNDSKGSKLTLLTYEDLVLKTHESMNYIAHKFELIPVSDRVNIRFNSPSWSSKFSPADRIEAILSKNIEYLVNSWRVEKLSEFKNLENILRAFNVQVYTINSPFPDESLRLPKGWHA